MVCQNGGNISSEYKLPPKNTIGVIISVGMIDICSKLELINPIKKPNNANVNATSTSKNTTKRGYLTSTSTKKFAVSDKYFMPLLTSNIINQGKKYFAPIPLGKTNAGMNVFIKENTLSEEKYYWQIHSGIGWVPPGDFSLNIFLNCEAGKSIMYDSMRLFLVRKSLLS